MPKLRHEAVVEILQNEPELVLQLLACAGVPLRFGTRITATIADSDLSDRDVGNDGRTLALLSDNVFVFKSGVAKIAVVAEVQTGRPGISRSLSWPAYAANARARHKCDSILMVFATNANAASASTKTILMGHPGWNLTPLVSGFGRTPGTPPKGGRFAAELVLLRVITGELELASHEGRMFALAAIKSVPALRRLRYARYIRALAPSKARKPLEELMRIELKDDFIDGMLDQGHLRGARQMMLQLLDKRFTVPDDIRRGVEECTDIAKLDTWFDRAITATSIDEIFAELQAPAVLASA
jgi:hypothetical protein